MRVIATIILSILMFNGGFGQDAYFSITGHRTEVIGLDTFHVADIQSHSQAGFILGNGQLYINYDTSAFGPNVSQNQHFIIDVPPNSILDQRLPLPPFNFNMYGGMVQNDNTQSRVSFSWENYFSRACFDTFNVSYYSDILCTIKLKYLPGKVHQNHGICLESAPPFIHQIYTSCGPDPCNVSDCRAYPGIQITNDTMVCDDCLLVYSTDDSGPGSLRASIHCARSGDTIRFAQILINDSIHIDSSLILNKNLYLISKKDSFTVLINGTNTDRSIIVENGIDAIFEAVSILGSNSTHSGTAISNHGNLVLRKLLVSGSANSGDLIHNSGDILLEYDVLIQRE